MPMLRIQHALRRAVLDDEQDQAGPYLGIPPCCCVFFNQNWGHARAEHQGDLAAFLLASECAVSTPKARRWQTNPFAMYFGRGMTWHFPCSWDCDATIAAINRRAAFLDRLLPKEASEFRKWQLRPIVWSRRHGLLAADLDGGLDRITLNDSVPLEENGGLNRVRDAGILKWRNGAWRSPDGKELAELLDPEARVLLWQ